MELQYISHEFLKVRYSVIPQQKPMTFENQNKIKWLYILLSFIIGK